MRCRHAGDNSIYILLFVYMSIFMLLVLLLRWLSAYESAYIMRYNTIIIIIDKNNIIIVCIHWCTIRRCMMFWCRNEKWKMFVQTSCHCSQTHIDALSTHSGILQGIRRWIYSEIKTATYAIKSVYVVHVWHSKWILSELYRLGSIIISSNNIDGWNWNEWIYLQRMAENEFNILDCNIPYIID